MRRAACLTLIAGSLVLTACGGSTSSEHETAASPAVARKAVRETRAALKAAAATYKRGDKKGAQEQVAEAYVSHFEEAEGPLEGNDNELKESLEHAISIDLRAKMKAGRPAAAIEAQVNAIAADLDKAEAALR
jgi:hypothetical protein